MHGSTHVWQVDLGPGGRHSAVQAQVNISFQSFLLFAPSFQIQNNHIKPGHPGYPWQVDLGADGAAGAELSKPGN
eukprot:1161210-Pelagomonas_calceolata.AAC.1